MTITLYRVQDEDGRGPWRPRFSQHWIDAESDRPLPADIITAFGTDWVATIPKRWHCGCACRSMAQLYLWFTPIERTRLNAFGYFPVSIDADKIIAENAEQAIFARRKPLTDGVIVMPWANFPAA